MNEIKKLWEWFFPSKPRNYLAYYIAETIEGGTLRGEYYFSTPHPIRGTRDIQCIKDLIHQEFIEAGFQANNLSLLGWQRFEDE